MCGICGFINFSNNDFVNRMNQQMIHRGPDNTGIWHDDKVCLGHTRLSIIDVSSAGNQPLSNEDNTIWITHNGEIYNFGDLRKELEGKGHRFKSNTDTEVIIHLYEEYGEECLRYLRGMFSFAIWDKRNNKLFAARDRFGLKPFFYFFKDDKLIFASELTAMLAIDFIKRDININALFDYFTYGSVQSPNTMIKGIYQLLPSHYLIFKNSKLQIEKYWEIENVRQFASSPVRQVNNKRLSKKTEKEYIAEIKSILDEAVKIRMISDVPMGAFLSGGIDSSVIVGLMQRHSHYPIKTFSVIFEEEEYDERKFSDDIAKKIGTEHRQILLTEEGVLREIPKAFDAMDQPSADGFNTFVISKAVKNAGLTVALSGLGGDELFAGYQSFKTLPKLAHAVKAMKCIPDKTRRALFNCSKQFAKTKRDLKIFFSLFRCANLFDLYLLQRMVFLPDEVNNILTNDAREVYNKICFNQYNKTDSINQLSFLELNFYLQNTLLQDTDRMSMANSLEVRAPFLDHILVEKMFEIPGHMKVGRDFPKRLLMKAMQDILPKEVYNRPKKGFVFPFEYWLKDKLKNYCSDRFSKENLKKIPYIDIDKTTKIWSDFLNGSKLHNYSSILTLLSLVNWYDKNIAK